jgi:hypothetical protein
MRKSAKIITALSVTGLAVAAGSAFTGAGLSTTAGASQFIGGTVEQTVDGATLTNLAYTLISNGSGNQTLVQSVALEFDAGAEGKVVTLQLDDTEGVYECTPIAGNKSNCTPVDIEALQDDVSKAAVTVE